MQLNHVRLRLLKSDYLLGVGIIASQLFELPIITSVLFYGTFFVTLILWICCAAEKMERLDFIMLAIVAIALINVLINGLVSNAVISFDYIKKFIMFSSTLIFFCAAIKMKLDEKTCLFIWNSYLALGILFAAFYITANRQMHVINGRVSNYLTFRFTNPNLTALFLSCMIMMLLCLGFQENRKGRKVADFFFSMMEFFFLLQTKSRNAILAVCIFIVIFMIHQLGHRKYLKIKKWVLAVVSVFPLLFATVYMQFINNEKVVELLTFLAGEGKHLDSRVRIWEPAFQKFISSPVFGAYYQVSDGLGISQLHNTHVDILASYGLIVCILVCIYLYNIMVELRKKGLEETMKLLAFICTLLLGVGEAALFSGGLAVYLFAGIFLIELPQIKK